MYMLVLKLQNLWCRIKAKMTTLEKEGKLSAFVFHLYVLNEKLIQMEEELWPLSLFI